MKKLTIVLAGHTGFVGSCLLKKLESDDNINIIPVSKSSGFDLTDLSSLQGIACDIIINLSGLTSIENSWSDPYTTYQHNYLITLNLLECARINAASFIQISSYVYGKPNYIPVDEKHKVSSYNPYASSKIASDVLCEDYNRYYNLPVTILRPFNLYGIGQNPTFLIAGLIEALLTKKAINIVDLDARRDYLWIDDFIIAIKKVIDKQQKGFFIYNVGAGESHSAREIIEMISEYKNEKVNYTNYDCKKLVIQECICNCELFSKIFDWKQSISFETGLRIIIDATV